MHSYWTQDHVIGLIVVAVGILYLLARARGKTAGRSAGWIVIAILDIAVGVMLMVYGK